MFMVQYSVIQRAEKIDKYVFIFLINYEKQVYLGISLLDGST